MNRRARQYLEGSRLVDVRRVPGVLDHDFRGVWYALHHVVGGGQKGLVLGADEDEGRDSDVLQGLDDAGVELGEHAPGRLRQALGGTVLADPHLGAATQRLQAALFERFRPALRLIVPALARLGIAIAGARIEEHQGAHHLRVLQVEGEGHVPAKG
jgi:hypothetical protein